MLNNYLQSRGTNEHQQRYFGKDIFNYRDDLNEQKLNSFQPTVHDLTDPSQLNMPLSQRSEEPVAGIFLAKRAGTSTTHSHNSSFCAGFQAKQLKLNIQRQGTLKDEKENSSRKRKILTEASTQMLTESEESGAMIDERQFGGVEFNGEILPFEMSVINDPQYTAIYSGDIFEFLKNQETKFTPTDVYMTPLKQPDINGKMRAILIDWLVDVHLKFKLKDETLYVTVALIDRYLSLAQTTRQQLQLVGVASMFIACKYEEIYPPELKDFVYITDNAYSKQEVLDMEGKILLALQFCITQPSSFCFLQRYGRIAGFDRKNLLLSQYILELAMIEYKFMVYKPSLLVSAVIYLVQKIRKLKEPWTATLQQTTKFRENELRPCAKELCIVLQHVDKNSLQAVKKKFSSSKFLEVASIAVEKRQPQTN